MPWEGTRVRDDLSSTLRHAAREGWATHSPTPLLYSTGAVAAFLVMIAPLPMYLCVSLLAFFGEIIRRINIDVLYWPNVVSVLNYAANMVPVVRAVFLPNLRAFIYYVYEVWPFILLGTALGVPLAFLRQRYGFYYRNVQGYYRPLPVPWSRPKRPLNDDKAAVSYRRRYWLPAYPHVVLLYLMGPVIMWSMAYYANPKVYPQLLYNAFAVWLASGVAARFVWELLQEGLLRLSSRWWGTPRRSLPAEYQMKQLLDGDADLSSCQVWDIAIDVRTQHAVVTANIHEQRGLQRVKELAAFIDGVRTVEVRDTASGTTLAPTPVVVTRPTG